MVLVYSQHVFSKLVTCQINYYPKKKYYPKNYANELHRKPLMQCETVIETVRTTDARPLLRTESKII